MLLYLFNVCMCVCICIYIYIYIYILFIIYYLFYKISCINYLFIIIFFKQDIWYKNSRSIPIINCLLRHTLISSPPVSWKNLCLMFSLSIEAFNSCSSATWMLIKNAVLNVQVLISCKNISLPLHYPERTASPCALTCSHLRGPCEKVIGQKPQLAWSLPACTPSWPLTFHPGLN